MAQYDVTVPLGTEGNAQAIITAVTRALKKEAGWEAAATFNVQAYDLPSYDSLMAFVAETVHVV